ncbi:ran guanine nucleotide release factor [Moniliophthora roreri MCA 2997]|uniref:Ran guanine nucleotide release factor n=2 Tax=Moniliophthora roreri TaxID=221103 RepID=V2XH07_MONRO|nr:ran guanine nucleotide release factor [Moniliophthora roreri MCA 2997]
MSLSLFGGAVTANAPSNLLDASDVRQVPDTQEVFLFPDSSVSIIVEILERVKPTQYSDAIKFHFDSLAHDNNAVFEQIDSVNIIANDRSDKTPSAITLSGVQRVSKFNRTQPDEVKILMALYRVEEKAIDLVVTFNVPVIAEDGGAVGQDGLRVVEEQFDTFVRSLRIVDFGLFA